MKLYRHFATVGVNTLLSRVFGFFRDILYASALGAGSISDAFLAAFRFPNLFRRVFAEGGFNAAFVPIYTQKLTAEGAGAANRFAGETQSGLCVVLLIVTAVFEIAMPWLMYLLAPGFEAAPETFSLAVNLTRITFPYLFFMSLMALIAAVLNAHRRFVAASFAPVLLNVVLCTALIVINSLEFGQTAMAGYILSVAVTLAGFVQLASVYIPLRRAGLRFRLRRPRWSADMRRFVRLGIPGTVAGGITQINIMIGTLIASLEAGGISYLYYADRIYQLPLGIVGAAVGVVLLPELARHVRCGDVEAASRGQNRSLDYAMALTLPSAVGLLVLSALIIAAIFEREAFTVADRLRTSPALSAFALGLPAFVLIKVFQPGFFSREDTRTPMNLAIVNLVANVAISLALYPFYAHVGIAIATSIAGWFNAFALGTILWRRGHFSPDPLNYKHIRGIVLAVSGMAAILIVCVYAIETLSGIPVESAPFRSIALVVLVLLGAVVYAALAVMFRAVEIEDLQKLWRRLRARKGRANDAEPE